MTDLDALARAVAASPREETPRLVYADAAEESGNPLLADFIRKSIAYEKLPNEGHSCEMRDARRNTCLMHTRPKYWCASCKRYHAQQQVGRRAHNEIDRLFFRKRPVVVPVPAWASHKCLGRYDWALRAYHRDVHAEFVGGFPETFAGPTQSWLANGDLAVATSPICTVHMAGPLDWYANSRGVVLECRYTGPDQEPAMIDRVCTKIKYGDWYGKPRNKLVGAYEFENSVLCYILRAEWPLVENWRIHPT